MLFERQNEIICFLKQLRGRIISEFEQLESYGQFQRTSWDYQAGKGGGEISLLRGRTFEKAAVNWSAVSGDRFPTNEAEGHFFATGLSLITHMTNPHAPTVHMNIRYIETAQRFWFGGGYDLTPMGFSYDEDTAHFHQTAKGHLKQFGNIYQQFTQNAKEYFYIPHYQRERGVGGIFFDHYNSGDFPQDLMLWQTVGNSFLPAIMPIYQQRIHTAYTPLEKEKQLEMRGHYVEFNLLYDRGTKFGFQSGGNPAAILCSMPPLVKW